MSLTVLDIKRLDPNLETGPNRIQSGPVRMRTVTLDTAYGEFAKWLYVGGAGNVNLTQWDGTSITLHNLAAGVWHWVGSIMINSSGTTATDIVWGS